MTRHLTVTFHPFPLCSSCLLGKYRSLVLGLNCVTYSLLLLLLLLLLALNTRAVDKRARATLLLHVQTQFACCVRAGGRGGVGGGGASSTRAWLLEIYSNPVNTGSRDPAHGAVTPSAPLTRVLALVWSIFGVARFDRHCLCLWHFPLCCGWLRWKVQTKGSKSEDVTSGVIVGGWCVWWGMGYLST